MIEKNLQKNNFGPYQKKIVAYLDGSLSADEKSEFEAFVRTNPDFEAQIKSKENELHLLRTLIPTVSISDETIESLNSEMKLSIFNLLKEEPKSFFDQLKNSWEEWTHRPKSNRTNR